MKCVFLILFALKLSVCFGSMLKSDFFLVYTPIDGLKIKLNDNLLYSRKLEFSASESNIRFDTDCTSYHTTHSWFYIGCDLPSHCRNVQMKTLNYNFWGYFDVYCYSTKQFFPNNNVFKFYSLEFIPIYFVLNNDNKLEHVKPVDYFKHFYIIMDKNKKVALFPRMYTSSVLIKEENIMHENALSFYENNNKMCVSKPPHFNFKNLVWYENLKDLIFNFDFPLTYDGGPSNSMMDSNPLDTSEVGAYRYYHFYSDRFTFPVNKIKDCVYYSNSKNFHYIPFYIVCQNKDYQKVEYCFDKKYKYKPIF